MAHAKPKLVTNDLIDKLNELQMNPISSREDGLGHVEFRARGLKSTDPAGFLSVTAMVAALRGCADELVALTAELRDRHSDQESYQLNSVKSLAMLNLTDEALGVAEPLMASTNDLAILNMAGDALNVCGAIEECHRWTADAVSRWDVDPSVCSSWAVANSLLAAEVTNESFTAYLRSAQRSLRELGYEAPVLLECPRRQLDGPDVAVMARYVLGAPVDELLDLDDRFLDLMVESNDPIFMNGVLACGITGVQPGV